MNKRIVGAVALAAGLGVCVVGGALRAQQFSVPQVTSVGPTDLFQDVVNGAAVVGNIYATAAQINNVNGFQINYPAAAAFAYTFANGQNYMLLLPTGAISAASTITLEPNPGNGAKECVRSSVYAVTANLTIAAASGQTVSITPAITALTANTDYCWLYQSSSATWFPI